jgi:effector-binding domain-containing protein
MTYDIQLGTTAAGTPLAVVRRLATKADLPRVVPDCCGLVWNLIRAQKITGAGRHVAIYLDDQINVEVGVELDAPFAGSGDVIASAIPARRFATTTHRGPYNRLGEAHRAVRDWCAANGHALAGPSWEIYGHWDPAWNTDPSAIRTDVFYLLSPTRADLRPNA